MSLSKYSNAVSDCIQSENAHLQMLAAGDALDDRPIDSTSLLYCKRSVLYKMNVT